MTTRITQIKAPEATELEKKRAELATLEARLAERELDLATLQAELHSFEEPTCASWAPDSLS